MRYRYKVRLFSSGDDDNQIAAGTIVRSVDRSFAVWARSSDEAEKSVQQDIAAKKLPQGRVYEICPQSGSDEPVKVFAACVNGTLQPAYLDPAKGIYSEFRRIRYEERREEERPAEEIEFSQAS